MAPTGELYDAREWRLAYVGGAPLGTYNAAGNVHRRFVPGAGFDEFIGFQAGGAVVIGFNVRVSATIGAC